MQEDEDLAISPPSNLPVVIPRKSFFEALRDRLPHGALHILGALASVALFSLAAYILANVLSTISFADIIEAVKGTSACGAKDQTRLRDMAIAISPFSKTE